ncbi:MAG: hypothetical protein CVT48_03680 [Thermoplasmata archaeon HGW-Thermoplasmata-1]|nr:MAG: hypothetical protein CVT48_03680 [Thermoplasmata archaeon HGW-Thermoplasmata-1]
MRSEKSLIGLISGGESERVEFKPSLSQIDKIMASVSAFSNNKGGTILVGVSDKGKAAGVDVGKNTLEDLAGYIKRNSDPPSYPSIKTALLEGKTLIVLEVVESPEKPVFFNDKAYKRVGKSNQRISSHEIRKMAKEEKKILNWDEQVCEGSIVDDIDKKKIEWFLRKAKAERNFPLGEITPADDVLTRLHLLKDGKLTNSAILLFGKDPQKFHAQAIVNCVQFRGTDVEQPFITQHLYEGTLFDQIEGAFGFIVGVLNLSAIPESGSTSLKRKYEIPEFAIREAIVNSVAHRDYRSNASIQVKLFVDRIEIWNSGRLMQGITIESLKGRHESIPRNLSICRPLYLTGHVQEIGSGTKEMVRLCRENGLPEPEFKEEGSGFTTLIWRDEFTEEHLKRLGLNERQRNAVMYVKEKGKITNKEYREIGGVTDRMARMDFSLLCSKEIFKKIGETGRGTEYVLKRKAEIKRK